MEKRIDMEGTQEGIVEEIQKCLQHEIEMINGICERYFDRMYNNIGFLLTFYGVIIAAGLNKDILQNEIGTKIILMYLLPFGTYILGVLYCNNVLMIEKTGYVQLRDELKLKLLFLQNGKKISIEGWSQSAKMSGSASILSYGCVFVAFVLSPVMSIGFFYYLFMRNTSLKDLITISNFFPIAFYFIYILIMAIFVYQIFNMRRKNRSIKLEGEINGIHIHISPHYKYK